MTDARQCDPPVPDEHTTPEPDERLNGMDRPPDERPDAQTTIPEPGMDWRVDLIVAIAFFLFGCWLVRASMVIPQGSVPDQVGPGGFGRVLGVAIIVLSGSLIGRTIARRPRKRGFLVPHEGSADSPVATASWLRALLMFLFLAAYVWTLDRIGFLIVTPVFVFAGLLLMKVRSVMRLVALPILYTLVAWTVFEGVFGVLLPLGLLERWDYVLYFHF